MASEWSRCLLLISVCLLFSYVECTDEISDLVSWKYHIAGDIEFVAVETRGDDFVILANYRGTLSSDDPLFDVPSSGDNGVTSGAILMFTKEENSENFQLSHTAVISAKYYSADLFLHQVAYVQSFIVITGSTTTSAVTLTSNGTSDDKSIVVGAVGNFVAMIDPKESKYRILG